MSVSFDFNVPFSLYLWAGEKAQQVKRLDREVLILGTTWEKETDSGRLKACITTPDLQAD